MELSGLEFWNAKPSRHGLISEDKGIVFPDISSAAAICIKKA
jgi:hypothetical protein